MFEIKNHYSLALFLVGLFILPGCYKTPQYHKKPLNCLYERFSYKKTENNVSVQVKRLNEDEKYRLFGQRSVFLYDAKTYQPLYPIHISIYNMSDTTYELSPENIDLTLTPYQKVAHQMKTSSFAKGAKTYVAGHLVIFATSVPYILATKRSEATPAFRYALNLAAFGTLFSTLLTTMRSTWINTKIRHDLREKTLHEARLIYPGQQFDTLVFVKQPDYRDNFSLRLDDSHNTKNHLLFTIAGA